MDEEQSIAAGILQALERGEALSKAKQSFINAGYSQEIVEQAARIAEQTRKEGKIVIPTNAANAASAAATATVGIQNMQTRPLQSSPTLTPTLTSTATTATPAKRGLFFKRAEKKQAQQSQKSSLQAQKEAKTALNEMAAP